MYDRCPGWIWCQEKSDYLYLSDCPEQGWKQTWAFGPIY